MRILFLGDIVGRVGRRIVKEKLPSLIQSADLVIANGENAAGGVGLDAETTKEIWNAGVVVITSGNHIWHRKDAFPLLQAHPDRLLRPANYPEGTVGRGWTVVSAPDGTRVGVLNLMARVFTNELVDCPFRTADRILDNELKDCAVRFVDFHGEATSEKVALGNYLDGRVTAVVGTHTHVQTADERLLPKGTAYISDVGMCGPLDSVIGVKVEDVVTRFVTAMPARFDVAKGRGLLNGVVVSCDASGGATSIERIRIEE